MHLDGKLDIRLFDNYFLAFFAATTGTGKLFGMTITELEPEIPLS